ncbi:MAG: hypothetical protein JO032_18140 [Alphaproteobacteria bacterium]|nr:hypothetical protein [Alphaproteobacteria bacterium]MBV9554707.1 hypothetical protein [Alphaproteobacteria bacterium]
MKTLAAAALAMLPLAAPAIAGSPKQSDLEEALRQQQMICAGMMDINARTGNYSGHQLAQCLITLESQRTDYQRLIGASAASLSH